MNIIGIIGAMEEEVSLLKEKMTDVQVVKKASMEFNKGKLNGKETVIVRSGICKVNAAVCTQILIDDFHVSCVMNTGIAGGLLDEINTGDMVISTDALQHDVDAVSFGYELGQIPRMETMSFKADEKLIALGKEVCEEIIPEHQVFCGRVVTGDQFIANKELRERLRDTFQGYCTEMEGAAIAQTAYLNQVPFVIMRAISDKADNSATMDYPAFEKMAIQNSVAVLEKMVERL